MISQPSTFSAPSNVTGFGVFDVNQYISSSGLGNIVAANYFTVDNDPSSLASQSAAATMSVSSTMMSSGSGSSSKTGTATTMKSGTMTSATTAAAATTTSAKSGAVSGASVKGGLVGLMVMGVVGMMMV